jgi:hypothetical protein
LSLACSQVMPRMAKVDAKCTVLHKKKPRHIYLSIHPSIHPSINPSSDVLVALCNTRGLYIVM